MVREDKLPAGSDGEVFGRIETISIGHDIAVVLRLPVFCFDCDY